MIRREYEVQYYNTECQKTLMQKIYKKKLCGAHACKSNSVYCGETELSPSISVVGSGTVENKPIFLHEVHKIEHDVLCRVVHFAHQQAPACMHQPKQKSSIYYTILSFFSCVCVWEYTTHTTLSVYRDNSTNQLLQFPLE